MSVAVAWVLPQPDPAPRVDPTARFVGLGVALAISVLLGLVGFLCFGLEGSVLDWGRAGFAGIATAVPLGWILGPLAAGSRPWQTVVVGAGRMGLGAVLVGDVLISVALAVGLPAGLFGDVAPLPLREAVMTALVVPIVAVVAGIVGLAVYGPIVAIVTIPCGVVWALAVRWLARAAGLVAEPGPPTPAPVERAP